MFEDRNILINDVLMQFNISLEKAVDYLNSKGLNIEISPNTKISYFEYKILQDHFIIEEPSEENNEVVTIITQYPKITGPISTGQTIDFSQFNKPKRRDEIHKTENNKTIYDLNELKNRLPKDINAINNHNLSTRNKKLGKVKFFDASKGFGYVHSYDDRKDCFIHVSKLLTPGISENDIVIFDTVPSKKKTGELDAIKVSNKIPIFIFNNEFESISYAYPLIGKQLEKQIGLSEKLENGFATITANSRSSNWRVTLIPSQIVPKTETISYGKKIIGNLLQNVNMHKSAIEWLFQLLQPELTENEYDELFKEVLSNFEQKSIVEINKEINSLKDLSIFHSFFEEKKKTLNKISFVLWSKNELEKLPDNSNPLDNNFWISEVFPALAGNSLQQILIKLLNEKGATKQVEEFYKNLISEGWEINSEDDHESLISLLESYRLAFPSITLSEENFTCSKIQFFIDLYNKGLISELSENRNKEYIDQLNSDDQKAEFIEKLPSDKIIPYYATFSNLSKYQEKYITGLLENEFSKIDFLCFDLESDGKEITEYAWKTNLSELSDQDYLMKKDGITDLVSLLNSDVLIIGQNIKEFDLPILENQGSSPSFDTIWDTFEVEMVLNPTRFSYGLKAKHTAIADTELTYRLFKNQLSRIISSTKKFTNLKDWLPSKAIEVINLIKSNPNWALLDYEYFEKQSNEFYRPNPTNQNISEKTFIELSEKIGESDKTIIIAPEFLWNTLANQFDINFYSDDKKLGFCLSKEKIESTLVENKLLKTILFQYIENCESNGLKPYFQHIPIAIQLKLTAEQTSSVCDHSEVNFDKFNNKPICIKPTDIEILKNKEIELQDFNIIIVGNELYNLTSKIQIGQNLDFVTIFDCLKNEPIWLQMSGGKSFISIEKKHCILLGINEFPDYIQNIWLEKIKKRKFKVCCNINFESCLSNLSIKSVHYIGWVEEAFSKPNSFIIRPDSRNSGYIAEQKRVNPESLNRKMYWVYQFKLLEGFGNSRKGFVNKKNPKILIVNDELELENLTALARKKGYFIPDSKASLQRQMELLHKSRLNNRLLITTFQSLDKVISSNYIGPLDFVWDSFMLQEKTQMLKDKLKTLIVINDDENQDDFKSNSNSDQKEYDIFSLIKLHKPLIDYYYKMLYDNNPDSHLFLCDTRLTDFFGIEKSLNLNAKNVEMWHKETEYVSDSEIAAEFFKTKNENFDNDFNIDEAKEILRQIFLIPEEGGEAYQWHDYQHPCLNDILPAQKDLLISLPTGAGKSLLFQGPALFRSAFTGKLTLIISPLRALMQDQVKGLNKKGFLSNVEYLSGDKTPQEIRDIYRRVSGGEITLLYITPERFRSRSFENCLLNRLDADSGLEYVVFDEAHCISQWGQEFRPDYLNAGRKVAGFSEGFKMTKLLFSATISQQVFDEISILMPGIVTVENTEKNYNPVRDHIKMDFKHNVIEDERLVEIAKYLQSGLFNPDLSRAIIFVKSRKKVDECALIMSDCLKEVFGSNCDFSEKVGAFHAAMDAEDREDTYDKFYSGEIVILFATKAFGMGMDIPNIHFVTHYSPPSTFEDFLQEVGRAGRNETQREVAGFSNTNNPIKTLCLTANNDFAKLKDQLHESRISWHEVKEIKVVIEKYIEKFKPLIPDSEIPVAIPFDLYSKEKGSINDEDDNKFRIALHWLERLERIKLGYFTITHLEFEYTSLINLAERINSCPDKDSEKVCRALLQLIPNDISSSKEVQISLASLRSITKLNLDNLFEELLKLHSIGIVKLLQEVVIEPTNLRTDEMVYYCKLRNTNNKYPALKTIFSFAKEIMSQIPNNESKLFEGEDLDILLNNELQAHTNFTDLPWPINTNTKSALKNTDRYNQDIIKKRSKHAFTIIRLLGKTKHETKMERVIDGNQKIIIKQSVFNGYHKEKEWLYKINQIEEDCIKLLDYVAKKYFDKNNKNFNWADIVSEIDIKGNIQYLSNLLFIVSILGYCRTGGLLPTGIEVYLKSIDNVDETDLQSPDKKVFDEFEDTRKVRELKLIALEVLSSFHKSDRNLDLNQIREKQDVFIKRYFTCNSIESLLQLLQDELPPNDPLLVKWRGDAIKYEEDNRLNTEQRIVYNAEINQHINVMAGPGSGKTHTLTLRVARLVHHMGINPEEILVLAYNRAVVSELKDRLGKLFNDLGYGNLAKRIKIFTFHGLAKRYCQNELVGQRFEEWENILLRQLNNSPGQILSQLAPIKHVLVDEFQDIDETRMDLLNKLNELTKSYLFIIGDPNQSIYGYSRRHMDPYYYYNDFTIRFSPTGFTLKCNHRSYPKILNLASEILTLPEEHQHLIPIATRIPDENFIENYAQIIDRTQQRVDWWNQISLLIQERVAQRPYKQIAILFRTNNEVYKGFQKVKSKNLLNTRIRIQGSLPYEFTKVRECYEVVRLLETMGNNVIKNNFKQKLRQKINDLIIQFPNWNQYYLNLIYAITLDFLEDNEGLKTFSYLLDYIKELSYKDDGQLYKIYEKHIENTEETEIVLTTMHKVKGLEFDCVIIAPSYSNLAFNEYSPLSDEQINETIGEEKRLAFVAYTRAKYRLLIIDFERELALKSSIPYRLPDNYQTSLGIPVEPEIKKLNIGWAASEYIFKKGINNHIKTNIKSGDLIEIKKIKKLKKDGTEFYVHEVFKEETDTPIGQLSRDAGQLLNHNHIKGLIVNEVVVWSYDDTIKFDKTKPKDFDNWSLARRASKPDANGYYSDYHISWCEGAKKQGYIYLVDFAGFGVPSDI